MNIFKFSVSIAGDFLHESGKYFAYIKIQFIIKVIKEDKDYYGHLHFRDEEMDTQRGRKIELRLKLGLSGCRIDAQ